MGWWVWGGVAVIGVIQKLNEKYFIKIFKMRESWRETLYTLLRLQDKKIISEFSALFDFKLKGEKIRLKKQKINLHLNLKLSLNTLSS